MTAESEKLFEEALTRIGDQLAMQILERPSLDDQPDIVLRIRYEDSGILMGVVDAALATLEHRRGRERLVEKWFGIETCRDSDD